MAKNITFDGLCDFRVSVIFTSESSAYFPSSGRQYVRPSVCPSVTLVICIKTVQARITKSLPWTKQGL